MYDANPRFPRPFRQKQIPSHFVTDESGDSVTIRDISSKEHSFKKSEIKTRSTIPTSLMPPGLMSSFSVHEMASLLDYLEALAKKK